MLTKKYFKISLLKKLQKNLSHTKAGRRLQSHKGFTLIEIIVTLVLVGLLAATGGMAIVQAVNGYVMTKQNAETTQKYQMAMSRINREIREMINIDSDSTATSIAINGVNNCLSATDCVRTIGLDGTSVKIASGSSTSLANGDVLLDNVSSFNITYYNQNTSSSTWSVGNDQSLTGVKVDLLINLPGGGTLSSVSSSANTSKEIIAPRNNGNLGGTTIPTVVPPTADGWGVGCFIATAAYGDPSHPMVQILRDFRDKQLVHWPGGVWFVKQYYQHSPAVADLIRERSGVMFIVRCLLAPFVALAFCIMYVPVAIPLVLLVSLIITAAAFSVLRRKVTISSGIFKQGGSLLIGLILTMVIMAALAAAMLPMFAASSMNQVYTDQGRKAYYLAESGFIYAQLQYREAETDAEKETAISDMHGKTYQLADGSSFTLKFYPYSFKTKYEDSALIFEASGEVPSQFSSLSSGHIRIGSSSGGYTYHDYTSTGAVSAGDTTLTFNGVSPAAPTMSDLDVQPFVYSNNGTSTITSGSDMNINSEGASTFPEYNGTFTMHPSPSGITSGLVFNYKKRVGNTLYNITLADPRKVWHDFQAPSTTKIILAKFMQVYSTGRSPSGFERNVIYNTPIGLSSGEWTKAQNLDKDMQQFVTDADKSIGGHSVSGGTLQVTSVVDPTAITSGGLAGWVASVIKSFLTALRIMPSPGTWAVTAWDWTTTETNLAQSFNDAGGTLSYDVQVKIDNSNKKYFSNGIGFRLRSNEGTTESTEDAYGYGVSIIRQRQTQCCIVGPICSAWGSTIGGSCLESLGADPISDGIPSELRPMTSYSGEETIWNNLLWTAWQRARYSEPVIVLWQRNGPATSQGNFKLLAYRIIQPGDGLTNGLTGADLRLNPWVSLMVRVIEGYELPFASGRVDTSGKHFKYGDTIMNTDGTKTARIVGTPVMSTDWGASGTSAGVGKMMLANVTGGGFASGENLYIVGGDGSSYGTTTAAQAATKSNYIMVYYSNDYTTAGTGNTVQADNTRIGNIHYTSENSAYWPPDDYTDRTAANDYFTLIKWHYITPGSNQVSPYTSWTLGYGWDKTSTPTLSRVESFGPWEFLDISSISYWDNGGGEWDYGDSGIRHSYKLWSLNNYDAYAQYQKSGFALISGVSYQSSLTIHRTNLTGAARYKIGDTTNNNIPTLGTDTYVRDFNSSTQLPRLECTNWWGGTIREWKIRPRVTPGTATIPLTNPLTAGTSFTASITVSGLGTGESVYYTIGSYTSPTYTSDGTYVVTYQLPWSESSSAGNMVFHSSSLINSAFTISNISVIPAVINGTLDTTADSQGNVASYVSAEASSDFYQAVIKTGALVSPPGTTYQNFIDGGSDSIALITSSYAGPGTFYDDFAVQLDTKVGVGFLPPIQQ